MRVSLSSSPTPQCACCLQVTHWVNSSIGSNPEQAEAVRCIVQGSSGQLPFIIWGPPGMPAPGPSQCEHRFTLKWALRSALAFEH